VLVSADDTLLEAVDSELHQQLADLPRAEVAASALRNWGALIKVPDAETGMELINRLAPEHFELCLRDPWSWIGSVRNAGAVFVGQQTPEPLGDYFAGPNHILPTAGTARFSSALSVQHFCKKSSLLAASPSHMSDCSAKVARLARLEGLEAHARSAEKRGSDKSS
jgi:histidinol dehydrogenase